MNLYTYICLCICVCIIACICVFECVVIFWHTNRPLYGSFQVHNEYPFDMIALYFPVVMCGCKSIQRVIQNASAAMHFLKKS